MRQSWLIPLTLFGFGAALACLWLYLRLADTDGPPLPTVVRIDDPFDLTPPSQHRFDRPLSSGVSLRPNETRSIVAGASARHSPVDRPRQPSPPRRSIPDRIRDQFSLVTSHTQRLLRQLDDQVVQWKSNIEGTTTWRVAVGWHMLETRRPQRAVEFFDRALRRDPHHFAAQHGRAAALVASHRLTDAREAYRNLLDQVPDDATAQFNLGVVEGRLGRLAESAEHFRKAVDIQPRHVRAWFNLASLAQRDGRLAEARRGWESFTALQPSVAAGWFNLGIVYMDYGDPTQAARCFSYVIMIDPSDVDGYVNLAEAYRAEGDLETALGVLQQADELSPCDPMVLFARAQAHRSCSVFYPDQAEFHRTEAERLEHELELMNSSGGVGESLAAESESDM